MGHKQQKQGTYLECGDQVFMRLLTETLSLLGIEIHKGGEQLAGWLDGRVDTSVGHVGGVLEQNVQLHFVILKSDQWQCQSRSLVVEEDQWKVEPLGHSHISPGGWIIEIHHRSVGLLL
jgi:hypothetical protein